MRIIRAMGYAIFTQAEWSRVLPMLEQLGYRWGPEPRTVQQKRLYRQRGVPKDAKDGAGVLFSPDGQRVGQVSFDYSQPREANYIVYAAYAVDLLSLLLSFPLTSQDRPT